MTRVMFMFWALVLAVTATEWALACPTEPDYMSADPVFVQRDKRDQVTPAILRAYHQRPGTVTAEGDTVVHVVDEAVLLGIK